MTKEIQENTQKVIDAGIAHDGIRPTMFDSLDYALEGYVILSNGDFRPVYNKQTIIETLTKEFQEEATIVEGQYDNEGDPMENAYEWYYYNILLRTGLSEGTPVFMEGFYDDLFSDLELSEEDDLFMKAIVEDGEWSIFECGAESFEYEYLLIFDAEKMKALDISTEGFPISSAFFYRLSSSENL